MEKSVVNFTIHESFALQLSQKVTEINFNTVKY